MYENGSYDDGQTVFLNLKDAFKGHEDNTEKAMARVSITYTLILNAKLLS